MFGSEWGKFVEGLASQRGEVEGLAFGEDLAGVGPGEGEQAVDKFGKVDGFVEVAPKGLEKEWMICGFPEGHLDFAAENGEGSAEFVGGVGDEALLGDVDFGDAFQDTIAGADQAERFGVMDGFLEACGLQFVRGDSLRGRGGSAKRMGFTAAQQKPAGSDSCEGEGDSGETPPSLLEWAHGVIDAHGRLEPGANEGSIRGGVVVIHGSGGDEPCFAVVGVHRFDPGCPDDIGCVEPIVDSGMVEDVGR
jgi:hypothetical protein